MNGINGHGGMNDYFKSLFSAKSEKKILRTDYEIKRRKQLEDM